MQKLLCFIVCCLFFSLLNAQNFLEKNCQHLLNDERSTRISVSGKMFEMISTVTQEMKDEDLQNARKIFSKIKSFELVALKDNVNAAKEFQKINRASNEYEPLVIVKNHHDNVSILINEKNGIIYEVVGFGSSNDEFFAFSLFGEFNLDDIKPLTEKLEKDEISPLSRFKSKSFTDLNLYPNPVAQNSAINIEIPQNFMGGKMTVTDVNGRVLDTKSIDSSKMSINSNSNKGYIQVEFIKDDLSVTKKVIIIE